MRTQRRVWVVSEDQWPRAYLRAELIERGYDAVGFVALKDAVVRLMLARSQRPDLLVVDLPAVELDDELRATLFREGVPVLVITSADATDGGEAGPVIETLRRPITIGAIADTVQRLLPSRAA
jgi:DNA-binding response OmpR family regulator